MLKAADARTVDLGNRAPRLRDELVNRRQLLTFARSFEEEIIRLHTRCEHVVAQFDGQVEVLRNMVGAQTGVEKEKVYPIFEQIAVAWIEGKDVLTHATALQRVSRHPQLYNRFSAVTLVACRCLALSALTPSRRTRRRCRRTRWRRRTFGSRTTSRWRCVTISVTRLNDRNSFVPD